MFEGRFCSVLSATADQQLQRQMGTRTIEDCIATWHSDAASPQQLDALAFQLLCLARRVKACRFADRAKIWKKASIAATNEASAARARISSQPNRETHPGFFNNRSVGKPQHLDCDLFLPLVARFDLGMPRLSAGMYEPDIQDGEIYSIGKSRDGKTWLTPADQALRAFPVDNRTLRGLQDLGRLVALPLSAIKISKAA